MTPIRAKFLSDLISESIDKIDEVAVEFDFDEDLSYIMQRPLYDTLDEISDIMMEQGDYEEYDSLFEEEINETS